MSYGDVNCPYCEEDQDINHDDGYGYGEDEVYQQQCCSCDKFFAYTTFISFSYDVKKADCLNGEDHDWKATFTYPVHMSRMECSMCGDTRSATDAEMEQISKERCEA